MQRCLFNLLFNAVKYCDDHTIIDVTMRRSGAVYEILVVNEGSACLRGRRS